MAVIDLPTAKGPVSFDPQPLIFGGLQEGSTGGGDQNIDKMGDRWIMTFTMPPLEHDDDGREWAADLTAGRKRGVRWEVPLGVGNQGAPGTAVVVDGAGQSGTSIALRGANPGYLAKKGYWLSIVDGGQHFLHQVESHTIFDSAGEAVVPLTMMLRVPFSDGAAVHLARPMIEGFLTGDSGGWTVNIMRHVGVSFGIRESK